MLVKQRCEVWANSCLLGHERLNIHHGYYYALMLSASCLCVYMLFVWLPEQVLAL